MRHISSARSIGSLPVRSFCYAGIFCALLVAGLGWHDTQAQSSPSNSTISGAVLFLPRISLTSESVSVQSASANWTIPIDANRPHAVYLPGLSVGAESVVAQVCPVISQGVYAAIPIEGSPVDRPAPINPDLNLSVRSYITTSVALNLVDINGPADTDAPQLPGLTSTGAPAITAAYQVYDWDWACPSGLHGCRSAPINAVPASLIALASQAGDPVRVPSRHAEVFGGGYIAMVLYAEEQRITLTYTRRDTPAVGYVVHLEDVCVDPNLLALYRQLDAAGRYQLPALHSAELLGVAARDDFKVAIRDSGQFMDPRSRKDWWQGY